MSARPTSSPARPAAAVLAPLLVGLAALQGAAAIAQSRGAYPTRPVRLIVPYAPGGASDFVARIMQPRLIEEFGQQVVIENRTGASGYIGVELAARATPDGYTILLANSGTMTITPTVLADHPVRPLRDLVSVTQVSDVPGALAVHPSVPVTTVKEFVEHARSRPGRLNYGSAGAGSQQRLAMELFMQEAGIRLVHIPYKGGAGTVALALVGGEVSTTMTSVPALLPFAKSGKLRFLAIGFPKRVAALPDVPTLAESGFPRLTTGSWQAIYLPAGTPKPVVDRVFTAMHRTMKDPDVPRRLAVDGSEVVLSESPAAFTAFMRAQTELWAGVVKQVGVSGD